MDVVLHPNFKENRWIYLSYSSPEGSGRGANTAIMRAELQGGQLQQQEVLYKATPNSGKPFHFGSRIVFDDQGYLYFSIGDRGNRDENPQDITRDGGKIYRINDDGTIPSDNPFVGTDGAKKAIYSYGHRNIQGATLHPTSGRLWTHEHGPQGGDEINLPEPGVNYGWPVITYGVNYGIGTKIGEGTAKPGMAQPLYYWVPSIAPSGMAFYQGNSFPLWQWVSVSLGLVDLATTAERPSFRDRGT